MKYLNPIFRKGFVCGFSGESGKLNFEQSVEVGRYLEKRSVLNPTELDLVQEYHDSFSDFCDEHDYICRPVGEKGKDQFRISYQWTPIIQFPPFYVTINDLLFVARESVTVCAGKSDSKLWMSLSLDDDSIEYDIGEITKIMELSEDYFSHRQNKVKSYYNSILTRLIESKKGPFEFYEGGDVKIIPKRTINISSIETTENINEYLENALREGNLEYGQIVGLMRSTRHNIFKTFFKFTSKFTGADKIEWYKLFIQNSLPVKAEDDIFVPYVIENKDSSERLALVMGTIEYANTEHPIEFYSTLGSREKEKINRRYRNSDLISRSLMKEIGRAF